MEVVLWLALVISVLVLLFLVGFALALLVYGAVYLVASLVVKITRRARPPRHSRSK